MKKLLILLFALLLANPIFSGQAFADGHGGAESSENGDNGEKKDTAGGDEEPECD